MTTLTFNDRVCRICSEKSSYEEISSTNQFGSPDLDLRPPEMMRSTMRFWVQKCSHCEYKYRTIDKGYVSQPAFEELKRQSRWQELTAVCSDIQLGENFAKFALILESEHQPSAVIGQQFLHAAWAADDENADDLANTMRREAAIHFEKAIQEVGPGDDRENRNFILLDILRRSGRFGDCAKLIQILEKQNYVGFLNKILKFQMSMIDIRDTNCHSISEIN